ncbi:MAG: flagellar hook-basal body complex protein FliE [Pseudomonadota bacterium]
MVSALSSLGASQGYAQTALNPINQAAEKLNAQNTSPTGFQEAAQNFGQIFDKADMAVTELSKGEGSAQAVVEAMAQAEMALQTAVTIRDRVVEAYQEILRMPV